MYLVGLTNFYPTLKSQRFDIQSILFLAQQISLISCFSYSVACKLGEILINSHHFLINSPFCIKFFFKDLLLLIILRLSFF